MEKKNKKTLKTPEIPPIPLTRKELKDLFNYHIPCLCCGEEMLHPDIYMQMLDMKELGGNAADAVKFLEPYEGIMHSVEKQVFNMFKTMSKKYPNKKTPPPQLNKTTE